MLLSVARSVCWRQRNYAGIAIGASRFRVFHSLMTDVFRCGGSWPSCSKCLRAIVVDADVTMVAESHKAKVGNTRPL